MYKFKCLDVADIVFIATMLCVLIGLMCIAAKLLPPVGIAFAVLAVVFSLMPAIAYIYVRLRTASRPIKLKGECRALLEILIREIQDIIEKYPPKQAVEGIDKLLKTWIETNGLRPDLIVVKDGVYLRGGEP